MRRHHARDADVLLRRVRLARAGIVDAARHRDRFVRFRAHRDHARQGTPAPVAHSRRVHRLVDPLPLDLPDAEGSDRVRARHQTPAGRGDHASHRRCIRRYVLDNPEPFIVGLGGRMGQSPERSTLRPSQTIIAKADAAIIVPSLTNTRNGERKTQGLGFAASRSRTSPSPRREAKAHSSPRSWRSTTPMSSATT